VRISITRTDDIATIEWDFPEENYEGIKITRAPSPVTGAGKNAGKKATRTDVIISLERKSRHIDALPDANSDYWYWFRITLKSGAIIDRGPIKAEYVNQ